MRRVEFAVACLKPCAQGVDLGSVGMLLQVKIGILRLQLRDPRVRIVRHHVHPGCPALLRDGARIARGGACGL